MVPFDETTPPDDARGHHERRTSALVLQAQRGDHVALERLVERSLAALTGFCRRLAGTHDGAQDLVQETLLRAVVSLGRLQDPERFEAWLFGIAANVARKRWQRELRTPLSLDRAMAHPDAGVGDGEAAVGDAPRRRRVEARRERWSRRWARCRKPRGG